MTKSKWTDLTKISPYKTSPRNTKISSVLITASKKNKNCQDLLDEYATDRASHSANYVIGKDGKIGCSVEEQDRSWNSGDTNRDNKSITIDLASDSTGAYGNSAYNSLNNLLADIAKRNNLGELKWTGNKSSGGNIFYGGWYNDKKKSDYLYNTLGAVADKANAMNGKQTNYSASSPKTGNTSGSYTGTVAKDMSDSGVTVEEGSGTAIGTNAAEPVKTSIYPDEITEEPVEIEWNGEKISEEEYEEKLNALLDSGDNYTINNSSAVSFKGATTNLAGIFGMPYQFSESVDPVLLNEDGTSTNIGRKFNEKVFSVAPVLFLTPGEPKFMAGYGKTAKQRMASKLITVMSGEDDEDTSDFDDGRYYSFESNFPEFKKYPNVALRALALYMGIGDVSIPVPGKNEMVKLRSLDIEDFMNNDFTKLFGTQCVVPFFLNAENSISESFTNGTTESVVSQTVNGFSQSAREVQFIMGSKDYGGLLNSIGSAITDVSTNLASAIGDVAEALTGKNIITRLTGELTTVISGGKIIFPEIYSGSEYSRGFDITMKFRSPDPDPVSIFLNVYMPIILLISMAAPRQIAHSSNSYESPFLVRATYKSVFTSDLAIIESLSINKGGEGTWNSMGQPLTADVTLSIKDLYSSFFISKRMGLVCNTAQMDFLAMMAGIDMNEFEPTRMINLTRQIVSNTPRDWTSDMWGGIKKSLNSKAASLLSSFADTRFLG